MSEPTSLAMAEDEGNLATHGLEMMTACTLLFDMHGYADIVIDMHFFNRRKA
jgi:hypothetical protein